MSEKDTFQTYEIYHEPSGEWAALYVDGKLLVKSVGDSYHADECVQEILGVIHVYEDFLMGGSNYEDAAKTTAEIHTYNDMVNDRLTQAQRLRASADELIAQARVLENG